MERLNTIAIPSIDINDVFQDTTTPGIVDSKLVYFEPLECKPTITGINNLSSVKHDDYIYLNTEEGIAMYFVTFSEPATLTNGQLIGENTHRGLWQHEYDQSLHLYTIEGNAGWIVVADFVGYVN